MLLWGCHCCCGVAIAAVGLPLLLRGCHCCCGVATAIADPQFHANQPGTQVYQVRRVTPPIIGARIRAVCMVIHACIVSGIDTCGNQALPGDHGSRTRVPAPACARAHVCMHTLIRQAADRVGRAKRVLVRAFGEATVSRLGPAGWDGGRAFHREFTPNCHGGERTPYGPRGSAVEGRGRATVEPALVGNGHHGSRGPWGGGWEVGQYRSLVVWVPDLVATII